MTVTVAIKVYCENARCHAVIVSGNARFIGLDGGLGGRWQCVSCKRWTERLPTG